MPVASELHNTLDSTHVWGSHIVEQPGGLVCVGWADSHVQNSACSMSSTQALTACLVRLQLEQVKSTGSHGALSQKLIHHGQLQTTASDYMNMPQLECNVHFTLKVEMYTLLYKALP